VDLHILYSKDHQLKMLSLKTYLSFIDIRSDITRSGIHFVNIPLNLDCIHSLFS